jgi:hypothetical protein
MQKRRTIIVDPSFQLRLTVTIVLFAITISFLLGFIAYVYEALFDVLSTAGKDARVGDVIRRLARIDSGSFLRFVVFTVVFSLFLCLFGIRQSHRIAGPIAKVLSGLANARRNRFDQAMLFRKGDYFHGLAAEFNSTMSALEKQKKNTVRALSDVLMDLYALKPGLGSRAEETKKLESAIEKVENILHSDREPRTASGMTERPRTTRENAA